MLHPTKSIVYLIGLALTSLSQTTLAQQDPQQILVTGVVPAGSSIDRSKLPYPIQVGSAQDLDNVGGASLADFMGQSFSSVSLNDAQNNPLQRDLQYRALPRRRCWG
jgi:outer membrane receptor protein involved in Fe transport